MRQLHAHVAYAGLLIVGLHVGLKWTMLMAFVRARLGMGTKTKPRVRFLRAIVVVTGIAGAYSLFDQNVGSSY